MCSENNGCCAKIDWRLKVMYEGVTSLVYINTVYKVGATQMGGNLEAMTFENASILIEPGEKLG